MSEAMAELPVSPQKSAGTKSPEAYVKSSMVHRASVIKLLEKFGSLLKWNPQGKEIVVDIGCGEGTTSLNVLLPAIQEHIDQLYLMDISKSVLDIAKSMCNVENVVFERMDIGTSRLDLDMIDKFDKIFSFFCLTYVSVPKDWIKNLFRVLKQNGQIFITVARMNPILNAFLALRRTHKWKKYLGNVELSEYFAHPDPAEWLTHEVSPGFQVIHCDVIDDSYTFNSLEELKEYVKAVTDIAGLATSSVPQKLHQDYANDFFEEFSRGANDPNDPNKFIIEHSFIFMVARKKMTVVTLG